MPENSPAAKVSSTLSSAIFRYLNAVASSQIGDEASIIAFLKLFNGLLKVLWLRCLPYYKTMIEIDNFVFSKARMTPDAVPGMLLTVDIISGKRIVMDYTLTSIKRATDVAFREK